MAAWWSRASSSTWQVGVDTACATQVARRPARTRRHVQQLSSAPPHGDGGVAGVRSTHQPTTTAHVARNACSTHDTTPTGLSSTSIVLVPLRFPSPSPAQSKGIEQQPFESMMHRRNDAEHTVRSWRARPHSTCLLAVFCLGFVE